MLAQRARMTRVGDAGRRRADDLVIGGCRGRAPCSRRIRTIPCPWPAQTPRHAVRSALRTVPHWAAAASRSPNRAPPASRLDMCRPCSSGPHALGDHSARLVMSASHVHAASSGVALLDDADHSRILTASRTSAGVSWQRPHRLDAQILVIRQTPCMTAPETSASSPIRGCPVRRLSRDTTAQPVTDAVTRTIGTSLRVAAIQRVHVEVGRSVTSGCRRAD